MQSLPQCLICKHLRKGAVCKAYPNGIPQEILNNDVDHTTPYKDDGGVVFERSRRYGYNLERKPAN